VFLSLLHLSSAHPVGRCARESLFNLILNFPDGATLFDRTARSRSFFPSSSRALLFQKTYYRRIKNTNTQNERCDARLCVIKTVVVSFLLRALISDSLLKSDAIRHQKKFFFFARESPSERGKKFCHQTAPPRWCVGRDTKQRDCVIRARRYHLLIT